VLVLQDHNLIMLELLSDLAQKEEHEKNLVESMIN